MREWTIDFPGTLRMAGPEWNTSVNYEIFPMVYETLLGLDPTTLEWTPSLASHWQVSPDKLTYRFRIDPNARFSDGTPVTAEDVVASWSFYTDKTLQDLYYYTQLNKLEKPVAEGKYIVRIKAKELGWRNFEIAAQIIVFPAHILKTIDGAAYLKDYNFKLLPGSGPYTVNESDIQKGKSVTITRRKDYWAENYRANAGMNNFERVVISVVRVTRIWHLRCSRRVISIILNSPAPRLGWRTRTPTAFNEAYLLKKEVFDNYPADVAIFSFNTRRAPWGRYSGSKRQWLSLLDRYNFSFRRFFTTRISSDKLILPGHSLRKSGQPKESL